MTDRCQRRWLVASVRLAILAWCAAIVGVAAAMAAPAARTPATFTYKEVGGVSLQVKVYWPQDASTSAPVVARPAILFFHGGGWKGGTAEQFYPFCEYFASRGLVALSAEYRLTLKHHTTPFECVADARSAMRWVKAHTAELGIDFDRIVAAGGSAGGQLATSLVFGRAFDEKTDDLRVNPMPKALVLYNPVLDTGPGGTSFDVIGEHYRDFSPLHNVTAAMPPTVIFLGTADKIVKTETARSYAARMQAAGVRCDLHLYPGQPHGFYVFRAEGNPFYQRVIIETDRFLQSLGLLVGPPTMSEPAP